MSKNWKPTYSQRLPEPSILDRRLVVRVFEQQPVDAIVRALIADFMAEEGYTTGQIDEGPTITARFHYESLRTCFDRLTEVSGYHCMLDEQQKRLDFHSREEQD